MEHAVCQQTMTVEDTIMLDAVPDQDDVTMMTHEPAAVLEPIPKSPSAMPAEDAGTLQESASKVNKETMIFIEQHSSSEDPPSVNVDSPRSSPEWQEVEKSDMMSFCSDDSLNFDSEDEVTLPETDPLTMMTTTTTTTSRLFDEGRLKASIQAGSTTLDKIAGKDVCLVIGKTGSGKSSLVQGIAGKKFRAVEHIAVSRGENFDRLVFEAEDPLEGFEIGHEKASKTSAINCLERKTGKRDPEVMFYVDSPGFEDTNGLEVDIATSIMIAQVAKQCKSLRFVILINYASLIETRGDAMRAVLKIIRTFVQDFEARKKSFAFLFSHTNEFFSQDSKEASWHLHNEIVHIHKGTTDEDVNAVLRFIMKSLEKNYPYVQIFHPLTFEFARLTKFVESNKQLEPVKNADLTANCALTVASQSTLRGEVKSKLLEMKYLLSKSPVATAQVKDIMETLEYLGEFVGSVDVQTAALDCKDCIERFCLQEILLVDALIERGTNVDEHFTREDAEKLRHAMHHLFELKGFSADHFSKRLVQQLRAYKETILKERCDDSFRGVSQRLASLQAWAQEFPELKGFHEELICHYNGLLIGYETQLSDFVSSADLNDLIDGGLAALLENSKVVGSIADHQEPLSAHGLQVASVIDVFKETKKHILSVILEWQEKFAHGMQSDELSLEELSGFANRLKALVILQEVDLDIKHSAKPLLENIKSRVIGYFQESASNWNSSSDLCQESCERIKVLQKGASYFDKLCGFKDPEWRETQFACATVLSVSRSALSQKAQSMSEQSKLVEKHGFINGASEGQAILSLDKCACFDELFDFKDRFLKNVSISSHRKYSKRMTQVQKQVNESLHNLVDPNADSLKALDSLKASYNEIHQISVFATIIGNREFARFEEHVRSELCTFLEKMDRRSKSILIKWSEAIQEQNFDKVRTETMKIDSHCSKFWMFFRKG